MKLQYKRFIRMPNFCLQIPEGETDGSVANPCLVLDEVSCQLAQYVPALKEKPLTIMFWTNDNDPICFRQWHLIFLNCDVGCWNQAAYQFAHELCHFSIPEDVHPKLRWLEESICQASSIFFLYRLADVFAQLGHPYATAFSSYAERDSRKATPFDWNDPAELSALESNPYLREKNRYVANRLLPIIWEVPKLWAAVPLLCSVREVPSIQAALDEWLRLAPQDLRPGLRRIKDALV